MAKEVDNSRPEPLPRYLPTIDEGTGDDGGESPERAELATPQALEKRRARRRRKQKQSPLTSYASARELKRLPNDGRDAILPYVHLLWEVLNLVHSSHLSCQEMRVLGHAMIGHRPTTVQTKLQIHKMRALLSSRCLIKEFIAGYFDVRNQITKLDKKVLKMKVRDFIALGLRSQIQREALIMLPGVETRQQREKLAHSLESFFQELPFGHDYEDGSANLRRQLEKAKEMHGSNGMLNPNWIALENHVTNQYFLDPKMLETIMHLPENLFSVSETEFIEFTKQELVDLVDLHENVKSATIMRFLKVVLSRIFEIQNRLSKVQQKALMRVLQADLRDRNYAFELEVRAKQAKQPDRKDFAAEEVLKERLNPSSVRWARSNLTGEWICTDV